MKKVLCFSLPVFLLAVVTALAAEFWEKKEYKEWSQKECAKILEKSPWADQYEISSAQIMQSDSASTDGQQPYIRYQIQFRSALPVRQALVRQMQIAQQYDKLPAEQRQQFDKSADSFLNASYDDQVVLYITYATNDRNRDLELARQWQSKTLDLLKNSVYLIPDKGEKVQLAGYHVAQGAERSFQFVFPRHIDGKPIITPQDKKIKLEFEVPSAGGLGGGRAYMEFKLEKMVFGGNIVY